MPGFSFWSVGTRDLSPICERSVAKQPMVNCVEMVASNAEQVLNLTVDREKPLSLSY